MKKKIDNRATCKKLKNYYLQDKINSANDLKKIFDDVIKRTDYGLLITTHRKVFYDFGKDYFSFLDYELIYPKSKIEVTLSCDDLGALDVFDIKWTGAKGETKYYVSY